MKRRAALALAAGLGLLAAEGSSEERSGERSGEAREAVVVELFTSQGCSSCPPADALLAELADREGLIALSIHVDYWDYLGWRDVFGSPANTERQKAYAAAAGDRMVYTPQLVVQGEARIVGSRKDEIDAAIARAAEAKRPARISLRREGGRIVAELADAGAGARGLVRLAWYSEAERVAIEAGENAGRDAFYRHVVKGWTELGRWGGEARSFSAAAPEGADGAVVMVQAGEGGRILCAARLALP